MTLAVTHVKHWLLGVYKTINLFYKVDNNPNMGLFPEEGLMVIKPRFNATVHRIVCYYRWHTKGSSWKNFTWNLFTIIVYQADNVESN